MNDALTKYTDLTPESWPADVAAGGPNAVTQNTKACERAISFYGNAAYNHGDLLISRPQLTSLANTGYPAPNNGEFWVGQRFGDLVKTAQSQLKLLVLLNHSYKNNT